MGNVKKIELVNIKRWNGSAWVSLKQSGASITDLVTVEIYKHTTGFAGSTYQMAIDWARFTDGTNADLTIFGETGGLVPAATKSIRLKYQIQTTSAATAPDPDNVVVSTDYYYQIIKLAVPDTGEISGLPSSGSNTINAGIVINMPAFVDGMGLTAATLQTYYSTPGNWRLYWTPPGATDPTIYTPATAVLGVPGTATPTEFGGHKVPITLGRRLDVVTSGTYKLKVAFIPNDGDLIHLFPQEQTCIFTVTVNMASQNAPVVYAFDSSLAINITFNT